MSYPTPFFLCLLALLAGASAAPQAPPVIAGLARDGLSPVDRGLVLLGELGCTNCHAARTHTTSIRSKSAPDLTGVGERVLHPYLREFLADPRAVKPGTTMPDVMHTMSAAARAEAADHLTHFLLSSATAQARPEAPDRLAFEAGHRLFHELGCVACHRPRDERALEKQGAGVSGVPLGSLEKKYSLSSLMEFLEAPQHVRASGRMPDLNLSPKELYDLSHYLLQGARVAGGLKFTLQVDGKPQTAGIVDGFGLAPSTGQRGGFALDFEGYLLVNKAGSYSFDLETDAVGSLMIGGRTVASSKDRHGTVDLPAGKVPIALRYEHKSGERVLSVHWSGPGFAKQPLPASSLQATELAAPRFTTLRIDREKAAAGRVLFSKLACVRCHALGGVQAPGGPAAPATSELANRNACLSKTRGPWPFFELSDSQGRDLAAALAAPDQASSEERQIRRALASFNCIACHQRDGYGGITAGRNDFFTSLDQNLGEAGRLPPPLTGIGAKLQTAWLGDAIAYGQSIRRYVKTRMPGFGKAAGAHFAGLFDKVDTLSAAPIEALPKNRKKAEEVRKIGHQLTGSKGMNCITCHTFGGHRSETMAAVDLVASTGQRLKQDWFYHYMLNPLKFRSDVVMPQFFPGGTSIRPDIAGGDVTKQLGGLWHYLAEGRNTRRPNGLVRPSMEIVVGDEAVMLRRNAQNTGKRGISVGYPGGVNLTFDAESLALNQIWWGRFVDASGVWSGQGSGAVRVMERRRTDLGKGPAFAQLANATAPWPGASRRELRHEFKGYVLDARQRPTFRYLCHGVMVRDAAVEIPQAGGRPVLRRTLSFESGRDTTLFFRVVRDAEIEDRGDKGIRIGKNLSLRLPPGSYHIRAATKDRELVAEIPIVGGSASLVVEYAFEENAR